MRFWGCFFCQEHNKDEEGGETSHRSKIRRDNRILIGKVINKTTSFAIGNVYFPETEIIFRISSGCK